MKRLLYMPVLAIALIGCENKVCCDYGKWIYRRSFAMAFFETKNIELSESSHNYGQPSIFCSVHFDWPSSCEYDDTGEKKDIYDSFCKKYGDMTYNREEFIYPGSYHSFQMYGFTSIEIVSDADFDDKHPKGTSLADLLIFDSDSSKPFIDSGYKMYEYVWEGDGRTHKQPFYPVYKRASELTAYDLILLYSSGHSISARLDFESLPTLSKEHTFTVTFTDERGEKFSDSVQMTFE